MVTAHVMTTPANAESSPNLDGRPYCTVCGGDGSGDCPGWPAAGAVFYRFDGIEVQSGTSTGVGTVRFGDSYSDVNHSIHTPSVRVAEFRAANSRARLLEWHAGNVRRLVANARQRVESASAWLERSVDLATRNKGTAVGSEYALEARRREEKHRAACADLATAERDAERAAADALIARADAERALEVARGHR